jgi:hypothetical protein
MSKEPLFQTEADLVAEFCRLIQHRNAPAWTIYHESCGWDLLVVHPSGFQIGVEAKLSLNAKVLDQALPGRWADDRGPDYRAVLVPGGGLQNHLAHLALHLGITVISVSGERGPDGSVRHGYANPTLPDEAYAYGLRAWPNWCPAQRCKLPDYVPDVMGGKAAPVQLSEWKIKAIKLLILLERRGAVTRRDMKALGISPTRWTDHWNGFLSAGPDGYVRNARTPDLKAQHPTNWTQIEADFATWSQGVETAGKLGLEAA